MGMVTVEEAEKIILSQYKDFGTEELFYENALDRILAENLIADRDLPPFDRPTVDGIALRFAAIEKGICNFKIKATQAAGEKPVTIDTDLECVEIMTGAALDSAIDTVVRYEDLKIANGNACISIDLHTIKKGQNIHRKGKDKKQGEILINSGQKITPAVLGIAASVGKTKLLVRRNPKIVVISTGDEMISPEAIPNDFQLRRSNGITTKALLKRFNIDSDLLHLNDNFDEIKKELEQCITQYDVLLISGGVSMGKFDFVPQALAELATEKLFHKIQQRPGKPFWFGKTLSDKLVFAFPGNPVSVFMCLHRYFIPWLEKSLGMPLSNPVYATLQNDISFAPALQYFAQVKLNINPAAQLTAETIETNGSGDFSHLASANAFIELPLAKTEFKKGEIYKVWQYDL